MVPDHLLQVERDGPLHLGGEHLLDAPRVGEGQRDHVAGDLRAGQRDCDRVVFRVAEQLERSLEPFAGATRLGQRHAARLEHGEAAQAALQRHPAHLVARHVEAHDPVHQSSFQ